MRTHLILPFIGYLLRKTFSGVIKINKEYRRGMDHNPALMIFAGSVCSLLFVAVTTIIAVLLLDEKVFVKTAFFGSIVVAVGYVTFTFFSILFNKFLDERQELFEMIKDDRTANHRRW